LVYKSSYSEELKSLLQVLEAVEVLSSKKELVDKLAGKGDTKEVVGVIEDVKKLLE